MAKRKATVVLDIGVVWGNLNVGDETARLGVSVERRHLKLLEADRFLCNKRLVATITAEAGNDNPEQPSMLDVGEEVSAAWDVHTFGVSKKRIGFGITCNLESVDVSVLAHFAKRAGRLIVESIDDIPEEEKPKKKAKAGEDADEGEDAE